MTISRRDTLRVAAALGASRAIAPFAVEPEDAAAMLAAPALPFSTPLCHRGPA